MKAQKQVNVSVMFREVKSFKAVFFFAIAMLDISLNLV